ncbi:hypothetical protein [Frankia sp. Cas4]|uniref:hypothetical protein n=1 Tax=Frankia sp. Cas4 TaxID=3073927 RepID=UPI002AD3AA6E|nr:hypothetical protein [Frankia sp. Cas4]
MDESLANRRAALDAAATICSGAIAAGFYTELKSDSRPVAMYEEVLQLAAKLEHWLNMT